MSPKTTSFSVVAASSPRSRPLSQAIEFCTGLVVALRIGAIANEEELNNLELLP